MDIKIKCVRLEDNKWTVYAPHSILDLWLGQQIGYSYMQKDLKEYEKGNLKFIQFTGLKDKNGKEIYEGDIVIHFGKFRHEVKFKYGSFGYDGQIEDDFISYERNSFNLGLSGDKIEKVEVIGNVYENPNLLL